MDDLKQKLTLDHPATYEIKVPGALDEYWSDMGGGVTIAIDRDSGDSPVTILTGKFDQAALHGILRQLYAKGLPLISVVYLDFSPENHLFTSARGRYD